jgi:drug/metabolite transporter (DMT)-like permease
MVSGAGVRGPSEHHGRLKSIATMLLAVAAFSGMDSMLKLFSAHYPPMQVAFLRGVASLPFTVLPSLLRGRYRDLKPIRLWMHLLRGVLMVVMLGGFVYALRTLSLANAYSIVLAEPLLVTALAVPLLGDRVGWRNWVAICVGLVGVLVILRPSTSGFVTLGALAAFIATAAYALGVLALRVITRTDTTTSVIVWSVGLMTVITGAISVPDWVPLEREHWAWLVVLGIFAAAGQYLLTEAFRSAPVAVVAPFEYTALLWGMAIDWFVWHVFPAPRVYLGGTIVIASGLYLIWLESQRSSLGKSCASTPAA